MTQGFSNRYIRYIRYIATISWTTHLSANHKSTLWEPIYIGCKWQWVRTLLYKGLNNRHVCVPPWLPIVGGCCSFLSTAWLSVGGSTARHVCLSPHCHLLHTSGHGPAKSSQGEARQDNYLGLSLPPGCHSHSYWDYSFNGQEATLLDLGILRKTPPFFISKHFHQLGPTGPSWS